MARKLMNLMAFTPIIFHNSSINLYSIEMMVVDLIKTLSKVRLITNKAPV